MVGLCPPAHSNLPIGSISAFKALESCKQLTKLVSEKLFNFESRDEIDANTAKYFCHDDPVYC